MKARKFTTLQVERAMLKAFKDMDETRVNKTVLGKTGPWDVTQEDWDATSFSIVDIVEMTIKNLTSQND